MIGISIGKLITLFLIIFFVLKFFKVLGKLQDRKNEKTAEQNSDDIINLKKDKDGKYH